MERYYFVTYITRRLGKQFFNSDVTSQHPFQWLKEAKSENNSSIVLAGWKEISEDEYQMYSGGEVAIDQVDEAPSSLVGLLGGGSPEGLEG